MNKENMKENMQPVDYLKKADIKEIGCVDERPKKRKNADTIWKLSVKIPGATYGIVDGLKEVLSVDEDRAWEIVERSGLPIQIHFGPEHGHGEENEDNVGPLGCGYANLVENHPEKIGAPEAVKANDRLKRVEGLHGSHYNVYGPHDIKHAIVVTREGVSIDTESSFADGVGILSCDLWAASAYAEMINAANPEIALDKDVFTKQIAHQFELVVAALAPTLKIEEIK